MERLFLGKTLERPNKPGFGGDKTEKPSMTDMSSWDHEAGQLGI